MARQNPFPHYPWQLPGTSSNPYFAMMYSAPSSTPMMPLTTHWNAVNAAAAAAMPLAQFNQHNSALAVPTQSQQLLLNGQAGKAEAELAAVLTATTTRVSGLERQLVEREQQLEQERQKNASLEKRVEELQSTLVKEMRYTNVLKHQLAAVDKKKPKRPAQGGKRRASNMHAEPANKTPKKGLFIENNPAAAAAAAAAAGASAQRQADAPSALQLRGAEGMQILLQKTFKAAGLNKSVQGVSYDVARALVDYMTFINQSSDPTKKPEKKLALSRALRTSFDDLSNLKTFFYKHGESNPDDAYSLVYEFVLFLQFCVSSLLYNQQLNSSYSSDSLRVTDLYKDMRINIEGSLDYKLLCYIACNNEVLEGLKKKGLLKSVSAKEYRFYLKSNELLETASKNTFIAQAISQLQNKDQAQDTIKHQFSEGLDQLSPITAILCCMLLHTYLDSPKGKQLDEGGNLKVWLLYMTEQKKKALLPAVTDARAEMTETDEEVAGPRP